LTGDLGRRHPAGGQEVFHRRPLTLLPLAGLSLLATVASAVTVARPARAQEVGPSREELASAARHRPFDSDQGDNPLRGSTFLVEQSMTTQTTQLQPGAEQSYVPLYEIWLSLRPRYYFNEHWSVRARFDYTKELTNNQATTYYREDVFGDIWTDLVYGTPIAALWPGTKVKAGVRAQWPVSKVSQGSGTYVTAGALASVTHKFAINGDDAPVLNEAHVELGVTYLHPFTNTTTPTAYGNYTLTDVGEDGDYHGSKASIISDQVQGTTVVDHSLWAVVDTGLQITPKLSVTLDWVLINQWHYPPPNQGIQTNTTGAVNPVRTGDTIYTPNTWIIADVDYALCDELDLSLGYYNLTGEIAPDGQRRGLFGSDNIWWSPDARVFLDVTANLDVLFDDAVHKRYSRGQGADRRAKAGGVAGDPNGGRQEP
jgi:hypothetical protein